MASPRVSYLDSMGIEVWVRRLPADTTSAEYVASEVGEPPALSQLEAEVRRCTQCILHSTRKNTVFGCGNPDAEWMLVGEAPGAEEDRRGEPFVGRAGQLLNAMLSAMNMEREQVYIANVLKCRPPNNRDPLGTEVSKCEPYLMQQVQQVKPKIILAMGRFAAQSLLKTSRPIGKLRGEVHTYGDSHIPLIATYHPAYLLRNPLDKRKAWSDLQLARKVVAGL